MSNGSTAETRASASVRLSPQGGYGNAERTRDRDPFRIRPDELAAWTAANQRARAAAYGVRKKHAP